MSEKFVAIDTGTIQNLLTAGGIDAWDQLLAQNDGKIVFLQVSYEELADVTLQDPSIHKTRQLVRQATELPIFFPARTTFTPSL